MLGQRCFFDEQPYLRLDLTIAAREAFVLPHVFGP